MTKDRLKDLEKNIAWPDVSYSRVPQQDDQSTPTQTNSHSTTIEMNQATPVTDFLKQIDAVRSIVDQIDTLVEEVQQIQMEMLQPLANAKLGEQLDDKTEKIKKLAVDVSSKLQKMEEVQESRDQLEISQAQWRIKESQIFVLTRRFRDTMIQYNQETVAHRERCKKDILHELKIAGIRKTNEELEEMLESGFPGTFSCSILIETQKAKDSLNLIEARHQDIIKLEHSIRELHSMFLDLARLVADQGEMIDSIEHSVAKAADYVEAAKEDVIVAEGYHKSAMKKKVFLLVLVITIVVLLLFILTIVFLTQTKLIG